MHLIISDKIINLESREDYIMKFNATKLVNALLLIYSVLVLGLTLAMGVTAMLTKTVDKNIIIIIVAMWVVLYGWIQYSIKKME